MGSGTVNTKLLTVGGYQKRVNEHLPGSKTLKDAYEKTEEEHYRCFDKHKYTSYESFRQMRYRWRKKKRK